MFKLFDQFTSIGFVLFHSEWNVAAINAWEFTFINLDYAPVDGAPTSLERILKEPYTSEENHRVNAVFVWLVIIPFFNFL
jgi:hypothetical protein